MAINPVSLQLRLHHPIVSQTRFNVKRNHAMKTVSPQP